VTRRSRGRTDRFNPVSFYRPISQITNFGSGTPVVVVEGGVAVVELLVVVRGVVVELLVVVRGVVVQGGVAVVGSVAGRVYRRLWRWSPEDKNKGGCFCSPSPIVTTTHRSSD